MLGRYDKAHLVPYGEYLPMRPLLSAIGLSRLAPGDLDFTPGPGPRTIDLGGEWGKVGFDLCYEIIFSGARRRREEPPGIHLQPLERRLVRRAGGRRSISPRRGFAQPRKACRSSAPHRRGSAPSIDARGNVVKSLPWRQPGVIDAVLPPAANSPPLFARFGNIIPLAAWHSR